MDQIILTTMNRPHHPFAYPSRRRFLQAGTLAGFGTALGLGSSHARVDVPASHRKEGRQPPLAYPFTVGSAQGWVLSDGMLMLDRVHGLVVTNAEKEDLDKLLMEHFLPTDHARAPLNTVYLEIGGKKVLVDCGYGADVNPTTGRQHEAMKAAGLYPEEIDVVVITHAHPDHLSGYTMANGETRFPGAELVFPEKEYNYWTNENNRTEPLSGLFDNMAANVRAAGDRVKTVKPGESIVPGLDLVEAYGHTPGHCALMVHDGEESLLVTADSFNHQVLFLEHPEYVFGFDLNPDMAVQTRKEMLDRVATDRQRILAYHFGFPGLGHIRAKGRASYEFIAEPFETV